MRATSCLFLVFSTALSVTACSPSAVPAAVAAAAAGGASEIPEEMCRVTQAPGAPFVPPAPYPANPPSKDLFWYGTAALWTQLPDDGAWGQLALGEKVFWWNAGYVWDEEPSPELAVEARQLDGEATASFPGPATNAYHPTFQSAILTGIDLPTTGCWEITGKYRGTELSFVVWVPAD